MKLPVFSLILMTILHSVCYAQTAGASYYQTNCKACHTIGGGKLIGPDLKDVEARQSREWLVNWIVDPAGVLASGDPYAVKILNEANNVPMIKSPGITPELANQILDYIGETVSSGQTDTFVMPAFTIADIIEGKAIFLGRQTLTNKGAPCVSCHQVNSLPGLGGGKLGLNLTDVYYRLGEARGLMNWLNAPPTPTMNPVFSKHPFTDKEIVSLTAFFKNEGEASSVPTLASLANFILYGILGTVFLFFLIGSLWHNRFIAVRKPMVSSGKRIHDTPQG